MTPAVLIPPGLEAQRELGDDWGRWLDGLPRLAGDLLDEWELQQVAASLHGFCSLVLPVVTRDGVGAALKITFDGDDESEHEGLALQTWGGRGAVRLIRADPHRRALLLDWLSDRSLADEWDVTACEVVGGLYARLHVAAPARLRPLASYVDRWLAALASLPRDAPVPRRHVEQALSLGRDLLVDDPGRLVHGDLHFDNVLADAAGEWVTIDPKPMSGDPHYEPAPMLWNRWDDLAADPGGIREAVRRRFHTLVDVGGLDEDRARDWVVVRMVLNAHWTIEDAGRAGRALVADERAWITRCLTLVKAVQD